MKIYKNFNLSRTENGAFVLNGQVLLEIEGEYKEITLAFTRVSQLARFLSTVEYDTFPMGTP